MLGDAALGLAVLQGRLSAPMTASNYLIKRYRLPRPRVGLGEALRGVAHAAIDISDGLVADLNHVLKASGVGAEIGTHRIPLSKAAASQRGALEAALTGGDDYELLFTAHPEQRPAIQAISQQQNVALTSIGRIEHTGGLNITDEHGHPINVEGGGWQHF
jgi:thiamine-monophosphate kinase